MFDPDWYDPSSMPTVEERAFLDTLDALRAFRLLVGATHRLTVLEGGEAAANVLEKALTYLRVGLGKGLQAPSELQ
jgi:hypothetical protein